MKEEIGKKIFTFIALYVKFERILWESLIEPPLNVIENYIPAVSETIRLVFRTVWITVFLSPIPISVFVGYTIYTQDISIQFSMPSSVLLGSVIITVGFLIFIYAFSSDAKRQHKISKLELPIITGGSLILGSTLLAFNMTTSEINVTSQQMYPIIIGTFYAFFLSVFIYVPFEYPGFLSNFGKKKPRSHINSITNISYIITIPIYIIPFIEIEELSQYPEKQISIAMVTVIALIASNLSFKYYKYVYKQYLLKTSPRFWLLPTQVGTIILSGYLLLDPSLYWPYGIGLFTPLVTNTAFASYYLNPVSKKTGKTILNRRISNRRDEIADGGYYPVGDIDIDFEFDEIEINPDFGTSSEEKRTQAEIVLDYGISIPEDMENSRDAWLRFMMACIHTKKMYNLTSEKDKEYEQKFDVFYEKVMEEGIRIIKEDTSGTFPLNELPYPLRIEFEQRSEDNDKNMLDLADGTIEKIKTPTQHEMYANK